jgi:hypothetical protein
MEPGIAMSLSALQWGCCFGGKSLVINLVLKQVFPFFPHTILVSEIFHETQPSCDHWSNSICFKVDLACSMCPVCLYREAQLIPIAYLYPP